MVKAFIEQIGTGHREYNIFGFKIKETPDILYLSNKPDVWILNLFNNYKQYGLYKVARPHNFEEREYVEIEIVNDIIVKCEKLDLERLKRFCNESG